MRSIRSAIATSFAVGLLLSTTSLTDAATQRVEGPQATGSATVDPDAVQALTRMSNYLRGLPSFEVKSDTTQDIVTVRGQRLQLSGTAEYKVRRPNGFQIAVTSDFMTRRFYYDGKNFTISSPKLGFYATQAAPPTIREMLESAWNKDGIALPLVDLFRWSDPQEERAEKLSSAFYVGAVTIDGVATDHYAFREENRDWEIWIEHSARPVPRKLVIVDRSDQARPTYVARLTWNVAPILTAHDFTFKPRPDSKAIHIQTLENQQG
jgi:hypothetical protein